MRNTIEGGLTRLKAYFILGLPNETQEDIDGIIELGRKVSKEGKSLSVIRFSCGYFVPKARTKFQDESIEPVNDLQRKGKYLVKAFSKIPRIDCETYNPKWSRIQAILSTGGNEISEAIKIASLLGGGLGDWRRAFNETGLDIIELSEIKKEREKHPWDFIKLD